ncbi:MAG: CoA transferase [Acidisphaera sp.]|nr:CoA transferase [Acidisphaera sp.]
MLPLDDVKVVDLSRVLAGPWCTMTLGDLGAEVWKIESFQGDDTRGWKPPQVAGISTYYLCANRNKRSIAIDLKHPDGQSIVRDLIERADVLVENMRAGTLDRFGLGWEQARRVNPRLIYCAISGYGRDGPAADRAGYDAVIQGESGLMSITGEPGGEPLKVGVAVTDIVTGMNATQAILAALIARGRTGEGQFIDMALLDGAVGLLANIGSGYLNAGGRPRRYGNAHPTVVPYQTFHAAEGRFVLACGNDAQFRLLCNSVLGRPELAEDARYRRNADRVAHRETLIPLLEAIFAERTAAHWLTALWQAGIPAGVIHDVPDVFASPEVTGRGLVQRVAHPLAGEVAMVRSPLRLSATPIGTPTAPPLVGEHTAAILRDVLGKDDAEIARLAAIGAVRRGDAGAPGAHAAGRESEETL